MPVIAGREVIFKCPRCGAPLPYRIRSEDIDEVVRFGESRVGLFHSDHILLCGVNVRGSPVVHGEASPEDRSLYQKYRVYVGELLVRSVLEPFSLLDVILLDFDAKKFDSRDYAGSMISALSFYYGAREQLLRGLGSESPIISVAHKYFDIVVLFNRVVMVKVDSRKYSQVELDRIMPLISERLSDLDSYRIDSEILRELEKKGIYDVFHKYIWLALFLKVIKDRSDISDDELYFSLSYIKENMNSLPGRVHQEVLSFISNASSIVIDIEKPSRVLKHLRPGATAFGDHVVNLLELLIEHSEKTRRVFLIDILRGFKNANKTDLLLYLKKLREGEYVSFKEG